MSRRWSRGRICSPAAVAGGRGRIVVLLTACLDDAKAVKFQAEVLYSCPDAHLSCGYIPRTWLTSLRGLLEREPGCEVHG